MSAFSSQVRRAALAPALLASAALVTGCGAVSYAPASQRAVAALPGALPARSAILRPDRLESARQPGAISVYPFPGTRYNPPGTQITFRGIAAGRLGGVTVVGSRSGTHQGRIEADSDGRGASFIPNHSFTAGETVTVHTKLNLLGAGDGSFSFRVYHPAPYSSPERLPRAAQVPGSVMSFVSARGIRPPTVKVLRDRDPAALHDIFIAPQNGPAQNGPMIINPQGQLIWFRGTSINRNRLITDFRVQRLHDQPVLTWWQGYQSRGSGQGYGVILNQHYQQIATVHAGNGLRADLHEFLLTNRGDAYLIAATPIRVPGHQRPVVDSFVQEIDVKTGLVLFEWDALDHVPLAQSYKYGHDVSGHIIDPYHLNSISLESDGDLLISMRNTSAVYKIDRRSGQIIWRLGGKDSSFTVGPRAVTAFQHDVRVNGPNLLTIFDNGAGPPRVNPSSRGLKVKLNPADRTATTTKILRHTPPLSANFEGSFQQLAGGRSLLGYGQEPYWAAFTADGSEFYDARFTAGTTSYRAWSFPWTGRPLSAPNVALTGDRGSEVVHVSWNGATQVTRWQVLAGSRQGSLRPVATAAKHGFETAIPVDVSGGVFEVDALNSVGKVIGRSRLLAVG